MCVFYCIVLVHIGSFVIRYHNYGCVVRIYPSSLRLCDDYDDDDDDDYVVK